MKRINKIINIALIFMLIGLFLCEDIAFSASWASFALRPPLVTNQTDFVVSGELKIDMGKDSEAQWQRINGFLDNYLLNLDRAILAVIPYIVYKEKIRIRTNIDTTGNRWDLFKFALGELKDNLKDHSDTDTSELYIQLGHYKENVQAVRIVSRNKESIKGLMDILNGAKIRTKKGVSLRFFHHGYLFYPGRPFPRRVGLIFLKEFAFENQGIVFIIDSNGNRISVSKGSITPSRGVYPGTEMQMIISIPSQSGSYYSTASLKPTIYPRNAL